MIIKYLNLEIEYSQVLIFNESFKISWQIFKDTAQKLLQNRRFTAVLASKYR